LPAASESVTTVPRKSCTRIFPRCSKPNADDCHQQIAGHHALTSIARLEICQCASQVRIDLLDLADDPIDRCLAGRLTIHKKCFGVLSRERRVRLLGDDFVHRLSDELDAFSDRAALLYVGLRHGDDGERALESLSKPLPLLGLQAWKRVLELFAANS
jgi:hypothetical protein